MVEVTTTFVKRSVHNKFDDTVAIIKIKRQQQYKDQMIKVLLKDISVLDENIIKLLDTNCGLAVYILENDYENIFTVTQQLRDLYPTKNILVGIIKHSNEEELLMSLCSPDSILLLDDYCKDRVFYDIKHIATNWDLEIERNIQGENIE